jgi:uncharacterized membrane protein
VANSSKDELRKKWAYVLYGLGLLGIISPILGFIFALPGYLIATEIITAEYKDKKKLVSIGAVVTAICILNVALGVILNNAQLKPK